MKIFSIMSSSVKGGATISWLNTILGLRDRGVEITVAVPSEGYLTQELNKYGIKYILCPIPFWSFPLLNGIKDLIKFIPRLGYTILKEFKSYNRLKKEIKRIHPDIIHTNVSVIDLGFRLGKNLKIPHIWHIREYGLEDFKIRSLYGIKGWFKRLKSGYSITITKELKKHFNLDSKSRIIYNGIEKHQISESPVTFGDREDTIIYVGRLTPEKGAEEAMDAFIDFAKHNTKTRFEMIGGCKEPYKQFLLNKIKSNGLNDRIILTGHIDDTYLKMRSAKAIIVPSLCEGFGRITAEAMLNGCLVIGRNTAGTKEQFDNGLEICGEEIGMRFTNRQELIGALDELDNIDGSKYNRMTKNALDVVNSLYSVEKNTEETYAMFSTVIKQGYLK